MSEFVTTSGQGRIRHYLAKDEPTLMAFLLHRVGLTREEAERLFYFGAVYQERQRAVSDQPLRPGQYVRVHVDPKRFPVSDIDWAATVVHNDDDFIVVNKPAGIPVHATVDNRVENVLHQLAQTLSTKVYITQRLDTEVGGLMVLARTLDFQRQFNRLLVERKVKKKYRALVTTPPSIGRHVHYMQPAPRSPKTVCINAQPDWLECALSVADVKVGASLNEPQIFEAEIDLETGRTHQIRAQLAAMGSPILGDVLYGSPTKSEVGGRVLPGIALFSACVSWSFDGGKRWSFDCNVPWVF